MTIHAVRSVRWEIQVKFVPKVVGHERGSNDDGRKGSEKEKERREMKEEIYGRDKEILVAFIIVE